MNKLELKAFEEDINKVEIETDVFYNNRIKPDGTKYTREEIVEEILESLDNTISTLKHLEINNIGSISYIVDENTWDIEKRIRNKIERIERVKEFYNVELKILKENNNE